MRKEEYKTYITGLKGMACLLIFLCHFLGIYKYAQIISIKITVLDRLMSSPLRFLVDEGYWLYLFFVISGYLVAQKEINSLRKIVQKFIVRFFRLAIPVFFAYLIIYILHITIGFHNMRTCHIFECIWYQSYYNREYSMVDVIWAPIKVILLDESDMNGPYWVLKTMFVSSCIIYILLYVLSLLKKYVKISFWLLIAVTFFSYFKNEIIFACIVGLFISWFEKNQNIIIQSESFLISVVLFSGGLYLCSSTSIKTFFFASLLILVPKGKILSKIFCSKIMVFLGEISWGVYSFHWPIICSVGAVVILALQEMGLFIAYGAAFGMVLIVTFIFAFIFNRTFEKWAEHAIKLIDRFLFGVLKIKGSA